MGVRDAMLALLVEGPKHGYQLKQEFEASTSDTWTVNIGQVYTTLSRLERDGLVELDPDGDDADDDRDRKVFRLTEQGEGAADRWLLTPLTRDVSNRNELALKLLVAVRCGAADPFAIIAAQRQATQAALQDFTALKASPGEKDLAWELQLDRLTLHAQSEIRWLDTAELRIEQHLAERGDATHDHGGTPVPTDTPTLGAAR